MTYQFKIQVNGLSNPEVWRQIEVPSDYSFFQLHQVIAAVFDKETDDSMFEFSPSGKDSKPQIISIELPLNDKKNAKVTLLSSVFKRQEQRYAYLLDFIEVWQCTIILEQIINKKISHAECLAGEGAYPPEACADPEDYEKMKLALSDKNHPEHESTREWLELEENETWESAHEFDLAKAREQIKNINTKIKSFRNYTIVKHNAFDEQYGLTPLLWNLINRFKIKSSGNKNKTGLIKEMESLVRKYPAIPHFKNTLATLYLEAGNSDHFFELAHQVFVEYPDYVLARCDLATQYIFADQLDKALAFLGDGFNLSELYPDRKDHFTEMETYNYHLCVFQYLLKMEDYKDAQKHLDFLEFLFPDEIWGSALQIQLNLLQMEKMEDQTIEHHLVPVIPEQVTPTDKAPDFEHPEIKILYEQGCDIKRTTLYHIMELPRQTLISDLEKILMDSIARFGYFREHKELDIPDAPFHALQILSALKAEEALDTLFTVLRQDSDYYDFWYGDILTEDFWRFIYMMGQNRLDRLKDFVLEPNHYTYVRSAISIALKQIAIHLPERKDKVLKWFEEVLQYMLDHHDDHNIFENIVYSSLMNDLIAIADKEQLPLVMRLYNKSLLSEQYCFSLKEIKKYLAKKVDDYRVQEKIFTSIDQYYDLWQSWLDDEYDEYDDVFDLDPYAPSLKKSATPFISSPKVGRNDPCPCGSGKKYKKCCGTNE